MPSFRKLFALMSIVLASSASAQHAAHEHGVADLRVVVEGKTLLIEFESPLANIVGFEHKPASAEERATMAAAQKGLVDHQKLFRIPAAAGCAIGEIELESPWFVFDKDAKHDHHDKHKHADHKHDHASHHGHETKHEHGDDHKHSDHHKHDAHHGHDHAADGHADAYAVYAYECARPEALDAIEVDVIAAFPGVRVLRAETAGPRGQGAVRIETPQARLAL